MPAAADAGPATRTVVLGGRGRVGTLFAGLLGAHGEVLSVDEAPGASVTGDVRAPSDAILAAVSAADVVVVALPQDVGTAALAALASAGALRAGSLLVEVMSVKSAVTPLLGRVAREAGAEACGLNPMFAPDLGFAGRAVAVVRGVDGPRTALLLRLLGDAGARLVEVSAGEHDRVAAVLQAATHAAVLALGAVVTDLGPGDASALVALAPPPHLTLLSLLARITGGTPEVYWDVQAENPDAAGARAALADAVTALDAVVRRGDREAFTAALRRAEEHLGDEAPGLRARCATLFAR